VSVFLLVLRWTARLSGLLVGGLFLALAIGEITAPPSGSTPNLHESVGISLISIGCIATLTAWRWELPSAIVSLIALTAFAMIIHGNPGFHLMVLAMCVPGLLYLLDWLAHAVSGRPAHPA
jgi:hypothetical protein